jgi:hypothetical protein
VQGERRARHERANGAGADEGFTARFQPFHLLMEPTARSCVRIQIYRTQALSHQP